MRKIPVNLRSFFLSSKTNDSHQNREVGLDFVRGIAILLAMGWHYNGKSTGYAYIDIFLLPGRIIGWAGVDLFFVLSGFLVGRLILQEYRNSGSFDFSRFLVRRAFKIWPVLYLFLFLQLLANLRPWTTYFFQTLFHVQNYFVTPLDHLWSLAVEEHFYIAFALSFAVYVRGGGRSKNIPKALLSILIVAFALRILAFYGGVSNRDIQWQTQYRIDSLAMGVALAYTFVFQPDVFSRLLKYRAFHLSFAVLGAIVLGYCSDYEWFRPTIGYVIAYLVGACTLLCTYQSSVVTTTNPIVRVLAFIGIYSYAIYIFHLGWARIVTGIWGQFHFSLDTPVFLFSKYIGAIVVSIAITRIVERPFLALRDILFPSRVNPL